MHELLQLGPKLYAHLSCFLYSGSHRMPLPPATGDGAERRLDGRIPCKSKYPIDGGRTEPRQDILEGRAPHQPEGQGTSLDGLPTLAFLRPSCVAIGPRMGGTSPHIRLIGAVPVFRMTYTVLITAVRRNFLPRQTRLWPEGLFEASATTQTQETCKASRQLFKSVSELSYSK